MSSKYFGGLTVQLLAHTKVISSNIKVKSSYQKLYSPDEDLFGMVKWIYFFARVAIFLKMDLKKKI